MTDMRHTHLRHVDISLSEMRELVQRLARSDHLAWQESGTVQAMLNRRKGESLAQLLYRLDLAIAPDRRHFYRRDQPAGEIAAPIAAASLRHKTARSERLLRNSWSSSFRSNL